MWFLISAWLATGTVEGTIVLRGGVPEEPTVVENTTDPEVCGERHSLENLLVDPENGGVRNVIVSVRGVETKPLGELQPRELVLDNVGCRFEPHASVLTAGSSLVAANSDPVLHTTHLYGPTEMNISLPLKGMTVSRTLRRPGLYVVKCDIHGWMQAFVRVDEHPFHAVTSESGTFRIEAVPAGRYTLEVWHEELGTKEVTVSVEADTTTSLTIEYTREDVP